MGWKKLAKALYGNRTFIRHEVTTVAPVAYTFTSLTLAKIPPI